MTAAYNPGRGLRRFDEHAGLTAALIEQFRGLDPDVSHSKVLAMLKRAAPYMGVPLSIVSLVDQLFAYTKPQDWRAGALPIVWPSNEVLGQKLGVTVRQVQKLLKQAQQRGLIGFRDSPNGHRGGKRRDGGEIAWAYGIVLAPVGTRYAEFAALAERGAAQDAAITGLRKRLAAARRAIRSLVQALLDAGLDPAEADRDLALAIMATHQMRKVRDTGLLTACVEQIEERARVLTSTVAAAIGILTDAEMQTNMPSAHVAEFTHSTTTNQPQTAHAVTSNSLAKGGSEAGAAFEVAPRSGVEDDLEKYGVGPSFITEIAPDLCHDLLYRDGSWGEVVATAERLADQNGIGRHAFHEACRIMGQRGAAASVIATIQKYRRGEVRRPGAYLRGMSGKAARGELNLGKTLHGLKDASRSAAMRGLADGSDPSPIGGLVAGLLGRAATARR